MNNKTINSSNNRTISSSVLIFFILFLATLLVYGPVLLNPNIILSRGNDLQEVFWPIFHYIQNQVVLSRSIPLWNTLFFSGTPLLPDPQFSLFYPLNLLFIVFPTDTAFLLSLFIHSFAGGVGTYLLAKHGFRFSTLASLFTATLYLLNPKLAGYLEAGHYGLAISQAWLPYLLLSAVKLAKTSKLSWSVLLAISLASLFYIHTIIFLISVVSITVFYLILILIIQRSFTKRKILIFGLAGLLTFGLTAISLLPQIEWAPQTTRFLLLKERDVYPKWNSSKEILQILLIPWTINISKIDPEKWLTLGLLPLIFSLIGFMNLRKRLKIITGFGMVILLLILGNNSSPLYRLFLKQDWYVLMRVSTRVWFVMVIILIFLAGYGLDYLSKRYPRKFLSVIASFALIESLVLGWIRISSTVPAKTDFAPPSVYQFLKQDKALFRVFCTTRCLSQKSAAKNGLQLVEGYNTLQQTNYYKQSWQLTGSYWNYYTLSIPPFGVYTTTQLHPDFKSLGDLNVKYIISPYEIDDSNITLLKQYDSYYIYLNKLVKPRAYYLDDRGEAGQEIDVQRYTPNVIQLNLGRPVSKQVVLAEIYNKGWRAYLNGSEEVRVQERPNALRLVDIKEDTTFVKFVYLPNSFRVGELITIVTILGLLFYSIRQYQTKNFRS